MKCVATHCDVAVRLDLVDPEALLHHTARSVQQLFELAQGEGSHLWDTQGEWLNQGQSVNNIQNGSVHAQPGETSEKIIRRKVEHLFVYQDNYYDYLLLGLFQMCFIFEHVLMNMKCWQL